MRARRRSTRRRWGRARRERSRWNLDRHAAAQVNGLSGLTLDHLLERSEAREVARDVLVDRARLTAVGGNDHDHRTLAWREAIGAERGGLDGLERGDPALASPSADDEERLGEWPSGRRSAPRVASIDVRLLLGERNAVERRQGR